MEELMKLCNDLKIEVLEADLSKRIDGLYCDGCICINRSKTDTEKKCILAEEIGHALTSVGNILDKKNINCSKLEAKAMAWAYEKLISLDHIITAGAQGIRNRFQLAEYLEVTEDFMEGAIAYYKGKYGVSIYYKGYLIGFEPLAITRIAVDDSEKVYVAEED